MGSGKNTYEVIIDEMIKRIILNVYKSNDILPSVRQLAKEMQVNPNTIQKVYKHLEDNNFTYSVPGKGHFVSDKETADSAIENHLQNYFKEAVENLRKLNFDDEKIKKVFLSVLGGDTNA